MEPLTREDFWKNAANRLEILLKSPKRHKYEEDLSSTAVLTPPPDRIKLKTSIMGRTYKNHDPLFSKVTERALNYQQIHSNHGPLREISPKNSNRILKNENPQKDAKSKHEGVCNLTIDFQANTAYLWSKSQDCASSS